MSVVYNLAMPGNQPPEGVPPLKQEGPPPGVPPLAPPRCWCERELKKLNVASDQEKCVGCGLVSQICTCQPLVRQP